MLEQMRKSSQSLLIYIVFGILIAVFIISFGPQSRGTTCERLGQDSHVAGTIDGTNISSRSFTYALRLRPGGPSDAMDQLVKREVLASEAERLGYAVSEDDVNRMLEQGKIAVFGDVLPFRRIEHDGVFSYAKLEAFTHELGMNPAVFAKEQERELLAVRARDVMREAVMVSPEEVRSAYDARTRQVNLEYVAFPSRKFQAEIEVTPADVAAYVKGNEQKLKDLYAQKQALYKDLPPEARVRKIVIKIAAGDDQKAAEAAAKKRADAIAARLGKGEAFAAVAREVSEDELSRAAGGDIGWQRKGALGLTDEESEKMLAAKAGDVLGPWKTAEGMVLLSVTATRKGTQTEEAAKADIAEEEVKAQKGAAIARERADKAMALAKAEPGKTLAEVFPRSADNDDEHAAAAAKADPKAAALDARVETTGLFPRRDRFVPQIGSSPELVKAAFALTPEAPLAGPFEVVGTFFVVRLKERKEPDAAEFAKNQADLTREAQAERANEVFDTWVYGRCQDLKRAGRIDVNLDLFRAAPNPGEEKRGAAVTYDACATLNPSLSALGQQFHQRVRRMPQ